ncbi:MAG: ABC transporter ATP-binding protein [Spiroplasma sp.]|nr:ABC transporter ATP-binding protein [Mycoplasmatales bacterium]
MEKLIEVKNLEISFNVFSGKVQAIRDISFQINRGETLALVGESGSGKSVTAKSLIGLLPAVNSNIDGGEILIAGKCVNDYTEKEWQNIRGSKIAMVFQDPMTSLNPIMKIGSQIMEGIYIHHGLSEEEAIKETMKILGQVKIKDPELTFNQYPHQLSGGMRQRIVIAIALACKPDILICDEPTTALDVTIQAQIIELIKELQDELGFAILFITHDLGVVANVADRVAVMYAGTIVEIGDSEDIFYNSQHPYTWGLLSSLHDVDDDDLDELYNIPGSPPNLLDPPMGDAFALRSEYALEIDFRERPPMFKVSDTHYAATWLLDKRAPKVTPPKGILKRKKKREEL